MANATTARRNALKDLRDNGARGLPSDAQVEAQKVSPGKPYTWTGTTSAGHPWSLRKEAEASFWASF